MSGHNKWSKIKRKKAAADQEKSKLYSRYIKAISDAARKDPNPDMNPDLKRAIDQAKENNVPKNNIENALERARKAGDSETVQVEAYGPASVALIIVAETDNQNRTLQELKVVLNDDPEAKRADPGSVLWAFESSNGEWKAKFPQDISDEDRQKLDRLVGKIKENEDVVEVYTSAS